MATYKAVAQARELKDILEKRLDATITESFTDPVPGSVIPHGNPVLTVKKESDTIAVVQITPIETPLNRDSLGLEQRVYTPHAVSIVLQAAEDENGDPLPIVAAEPNILIPLVCDIALIGMQVRVYVTDQTPAVEEIKPENLVTTYHSHLYWKSMASI